VEVTIVFEVSTSIGMRAQKRGFNLKRRGKTGIFVRGWLSLSDVCSIVGKRVDIHTEEDTWPGGGRKGVTNYERDGTGQFSRLIGCVNNQRAGH